MEELKTVKDVGNFQVEEGRVFNSATHEEIARGVTSDLYFVRTRELLSHAGKESTSVVAEIFTTRSGILCGTEEAIRLLQGKKVSLWAVPEGEEVKSKDVVMRIDGSYDEFAMYETALLGILASSSGWATAAWECKKAAGEKPVFCFGARHLHPAVAPVMERASIVGGIDNCSCILGAKLLGREPIGTVPHAAVLIMGDTVKTAMLYDQVMPEGSPRIILVDTFKDEAEETLRVAEALGSRLDGVRLDTPGERGGVTPGLVQEVRARLDLKGFSHVQIFVSGGINPERIALLSEAGADAFGVGSFISAAHPLDMTMDLKEIEGRSLAKRGRIPGITPSPRLVRYN
jgi:nicotinate phosphoribosyltransferase